LVLIFLYYNFYFKNVNFSHTVQQSLPCCSSNCSSIRTVDSGTSYCYSNNSEQHNKGGIITQLRPSSIGSTAIADPTNSGYFL